MLKIVLDFVKPATTKNVFKEESLLSFPLVRTKTITYFYQIL